MILLTHARASVPSAACRCLTATDVFEHIPKSLPAASNKTTAKTSCSLYPSHRETHVCLQTSVIVLDACLTTRQRRRRRRRWGRGRRRRGRRRVENNIIYQQRRRRRRRRRRVENNIIYQQRRRRRRRRWRRRRRRRRRHHEVKASWRDNEGDAKVETFPPRWK